MRNTSPPSARPLPELQLDVCLDTEAPAGNILRPLAQLLLAMAARPAVAGEAVAEGREGEEVAEEKRPVTRSDSGTGRRDCC